MTTRKIRIQGMSAPQDVERVEDAIRGVWGIQEVAIQPDKAEVTFSFDERAAKYEDFKTAVLDRGYGVVDGEPNL